MGSVSEGMAEWEILLDTVQAGVGDFETCLLYLVGRAYGLGVSLIGIRKMSAFTFWFKFRGEPDVTKSFLVRQAIRGFRKGVQTTHFLSVVFIVRGQIGSSRFEIALLCLAFSLAFWGF